MNQMHTFGSTEHEPVDTPAYPTHPGGDAVIPGQPGAPEAEMVPAGPRRLNPLALGGLAAAGLLAVGAVAYLLLGGSEDPVTTPFVPVASGPAAVTDGSLVSPTVSPGVPGAAGAAGRNPFAGGVAEAAAAAGAAPAAGGAAPAPAPVASTITATVTRRVTSTVSVPVVSTIEVPVPTVVVSPTTITSTTTPDDAVYVTLWNGTSGTLVVNANLVDVTSVPLDTNGIRVTDTNAGDSCVTVRLVAAADSAAKLVCQGEAVGLG